MESYKLPGSSYEELIKIIKAYATGKVGVPVPLETIAQTVKMDKTIVSRNNGFLVQLNIISDGSKKGPTQFGSDLGRAYTLNMREQIVKLLKSAIENDEFLNRMVSAIRIRNGLEKTELLNHIIYSSGSTNTNNARAGANTVIEIFKTAQLVSEADGKISPVDEVAEYINVIENNIPKGEIVKSEESCNETRSVQRGNANISISINLQVKIEDLETLPEKIKALINSLSEAD